MTKKAKNKAQLLLIYCYQSLSVSVEKTHSHILAVWKCNLQYNRQHAHVSNGQGISMSTTTTTTKLLKMHTKSSLSSDGRGQMCLFAVVIALRTFVVATQLRTKRKRSSSEDGSEIINTGRCLRRRRAQNGVAWGAHLAVVIVVRKKVRMEPKRPRPSGVFFAILLHQCKYVCV